MINAQHFHRRYLRPMSLPTKTFIILLSMSACKAFTSSSWSHQVHYLLGRQIKGKSAPVHAVQAPTCSGSVGSGSRRSRSRLKRRSLLSCNVSVRRWPTYTLQQNSSGVHWSKQLRHDQLHLQRRRLSWPPVLSMANDEESTPSTTPPSPSPSPASSSSSPLPAAEALPTALSSPDPAGASGDNGSHVFTARRRPFEASVQKWCDRGTSAFPFWVLGAAALGLWRPAALAWMKSDLITIALATTMVSMGMTLRVDDFKAVARRPRPVLAGVAAQYTIMPSLGYMVAKLFRLPPALAAGVTLVGCCPGGSASNLVTLIANGDVALSVAMTTVSTTLAAVITGPLTKVLVGATVEISAVTLMRATAQVVFLPVALGLLLNTYATGITRRLSPYTPLLCVCLVAMICGSVVAGNAAILLRSGGALVGAVLTLHAAGFAIGYGGMRALGFTEQEARTTSIEVGMQNSALAVVLAQRGLPDPLSAVPGAVSATCHSLIGSIAAAFWRTADKNERSARKASETRKPPAVTVSPSAGVEGRERS